MGETKEELLRQFQELWQLNEREESDEQRFQWRGRQLERIVYELLSLERLSPKRNIRLPGEQLDLFLTDGHRYFLLEAKWRKELAAADVFAFRGKLEGKLTGTLGIFLDAAGCLSQEGLKSLTWGKQINCLIFKGEDLHYALQPQHSFTKILAAKLQRAASHGEPDYPYREFLDKEEITP
jgi:hypothetical protein